MTDIIECLYSEVSCHGLFRRGYICRYYIWCQLKGAVEKHLIWINAAEYIHHDIHRYHIVHILTSLEIIQMSIAEWAHVLSQTPSRVEVMTTPDDDGDVVKCPICFDDMYWARETECGHLFHTSCLNIWVHRMHHDTCPICRSTIDIME